MNDSYPSEEQEEEGSFESGQGNMNLANASFPQSSDLKDAQNATKKVSVDEITHPGGKEEQQRSANNDSLVESISAEVNVGSGCSYSEEMSVSGDGDIARGSTLSEPTNTQQTEDFSPSGVAATQCGPRNFKQTLGKGY